MSTIVGIRANHGCEGVVIAADTQFTFYDNDGNRLSKKYASKIRTLGNHALAFAGTCDRYLDHFIAYCKGNRTFHQFCERVGVIDSHPTSILQGLSAAQRKKLIQRTKDLKALYESLKTANSDPVKDALRTGFFQEAVVLNRSICRRKSEETLEFILGSNSDGVILRKIDALGNVLKPSLAENFEYFCCGSGSENVTKCVESELYNEDIQLVKAIGEIDYDHISIPVAIALANCLIKNAFQDDDTGGFVDLAVVTQEKVEHFGPLLFKALNSAERKIYLEIMRKYEK